MNRIMQPLPGSRRVCIIGLVAAAEGLALFCRAEAVGFGDLTEARQAGVILSQTTGEAQAKPAPSDESLVLSAIRKRLETNPDVQVVEMKVDPAYAGPTNTYLVNVVMAEKDGRVVSLGVIATLGLGSDGEKQVLSVTYVD